MKIGDVVIITGGPLEGLTSVVREDLDNGYVYMTFDLAEFINAVGDRQWVIDEDGRVPIAIDSEHVSAL